MEAVDFMERKRKLLSNKQITIADLYTQAAILGLVILPCAGNAIPGKISAFVTVEGEDHYIFPADQMVAV